jgi:hypothetical protein
MPKKLHIPASKYDGPHENQPAPVVNENPPAQSVQQALANAERLVENAKQK